MSTIDALTSESAATDLRDFEYRPVSTAAIASLVFGALSAVVFFGARDSFESCLMLCPIPLIGLLFGFRALSRITAHPDHTSGRGMALLGTALSAACLIGGLSYAGFVYATEVPDGYARTSFEDFRPDEVEIRGDVLVPPDIKALDGKKVFIKGYIRPKYFDQIDVTTTGKVTVDSSLRVFRLGGVLRVLPENIFKGPTVPVFKLEADYAQ
jgi:hypothetical protein